MQIFRYTRGIFAFVLFLIITMGLFGTTILGLSLVKPWRHTRLGKGLWKRLEKCPWLWVHTMWNWVLGPIMLMKIKVHGRLPELPQGQQRITIANHGTFIGVLGAAYLSMCMQNTTPQIIGKVESQRHPIVGFIVGTAKVLGWIIFIDRHNRKQAVTAIRNSVAMQMGKTWNYILFPDGTRPTPKHIKESQKKFAHIKNVEIIFSETCVPKWRGFYTLVSALRENHVAFQVIKATIAFNQEDTGLFSLFELVGATLHIHIENVSEQVEEIQSEVQFEEHILVWWKKMNHMIRAWRSADHTK